MCLSICFENLLNDHPPKFNKKLNTRQMIDPKPCALIDRLSTILLPKNAGSGFIFVDDNMNVTLSNEVIEKSLSIFVHSCVMFFHWFICLWTYDF